MTGSTSLGVQAQADARSARADAHSARVATEQSDCLDETKQQSDNSRVRLVLSAVPSRAAVNFSKLKALPASHHLLLL